MINRRIFIKKGFYAGAGGVLAIPFFGCKKDDPKDDPGNNTPTHPPITPELGMDLYGSIIDEEGNPVAGIVVSDGYSCTVTDDNGIYRMKKNTKAIMVYYSTPSEYEINTLNSTVSTASFYTALISTSKRYNFNLKKLPGVETEFNLLCIGDPQVTNAAEIERFKNETMVDLKAFVDASDKPCYGLVMGDVTGDHPEFFTQMRTIMGSTDMPIFNTIGNHDKTGGDASTPRNAAAFCAVYGPLDYSFNRGNIHFVCLDNIIYTNKDNYSGGFEDHQIEWLKQDLSYVPKNKAIVVFYHIPIRNTSGIKNRIELLNLLKDFSDVQLMCGHTHYNENFLITSPINSYEHIHAAACGSWWRSVINGDGTPNGYAVYEIKGNNATNWFYKPTNYSKDFQIRLHWGDAEFGGQYGYYKYSQGGGTIIANVWNADKNWKIEAYEDGVKVADLTKLSDSTKDAWSLGYHIGVLNRNPSNYSPNCKHVYVHRIVNPNATPEIRAADPFGNVYTQREIIINMDTAASN